MNIWKDVYFKNKGRGRVPAYPLADQNPHSQQEEQQSSELVTNPNDSPHGSFKDMSSRNGKPNGKPLPVNGAADQGAKQAAAKTMKSRFRPKTPSDKLSTAYPPILSKMSYQLSYIWSNILVEAKKNVETLLVCGAARKEGNTFIAFHLAMFLSKEYHLSVLYVDTNPNHGVFPKMKKLPGLYSFITENKDLSSLILQTEYPGFYLLPSGAGDNKNIGGNMLSRESIESLNDYCRKNFDVTIIDGQPLTTNPVMFELAKAVDMTALVCRYGYSRWEVSKLAIDRLQKYGVANVGVILNDRQFPVPPKIYKLMG